MKRVIVMILTCVVGVMADWLITQRAVDNTPPIPAVEAPLQPATASVVPTAVVAPVPAASPKPHFILDFDPDTFYPYGMYHLMGPKPKEFETFEGFELGAPGYSEDDAAYIAALKRYPDESLGGPTAVFALITKRRLVFATSKSSDAGIEYRFDGEFLRTDFDAVSGKDKPVLRGVLTRSKDGRTLAERTVTFSFVYMGC